MHIEPLTLTGRVVRLEPLTEAHAPTLTPMAQDDGIWLYMLYGNLRTEAEVRGMIQGLLQRQARGTDLPFVVIHLETGQPVGMTRYMEIQHPQRNLEIGGTWYGAAYRRTAVNTECKYLLLRQAFEGYGCVRVQIKTDLRNERSQRAIERLGAVREGVLRRNIIMPDGYIRDSVYYSILDSEWPDVKKKLEEKLNH